MEVLETPKWEQKLTPKMTLLLLDPLRTLQGTLPGPLGGKGKGNEKEKGKGNEEEKGNGREKYKENLRGAVAGPASLSLCVPLSCPVMSWCRVMSCRVASRCVVS